MKSTPYDLKAVEEVCRELSIPTEVNSDEVRVKLGADVTLTIANVLEEQDTFLGFDDVPWHTHGHLTLMTGLDTSVSYAPDELLLAIFTGDVFLVTEKRDGKVSDRWFIHKNGRLDLEWLGTGDEITVKSIAEQRASCPPYQPRCLDDFPYFHPQPRDRHAPSLVGVHALIDI